MVHSWPGSLISPNIWNMPITIVGDDWTGFEKLAFTMSSGRRVSRIADGLETTEMRTTHHGSGGTATGESKQKHHSQHDVHTYITHT